MKKLVIVLIFFAIISPVFAQSNSGDDSNMYVLNVAIEKIYPSSMGYVIQYQKSSSVNLGTVGIPNEWFMGAKSGDSQSEAISAPAGFQYVAAGKAEIIRLPSGVNWPSMSVFYVNGKFSHVRLYVHRYKGHQTWGNIPQGVDVSRHFKNMDTLEIDF